MRNRLFRVVSPAEWGLIIDSRLQRAADRLHKTCEPQKILSAEEYKHTLKHPKIQQVKDAKDAEVLLTYASKPDIDYDSKEYHGSYADDDIDVVPNRKEASHDL